VVVKTIRIWMTFWIVFKIKVLFLLLNFLLSLLSTVPLPRLRLPLPEALLLLRMMAITVLLQRHR